MIKAAGISPAAFSLSKKGGSFSKITPTPPPPPEGEGLYFVGTAAEQPVPSVSLCSTSPHPVGSHPRPAKRLSPFESMSFFDSKSCRNFSCSFLCSVHRCYKIRPLRRPASFYIETFRRKIAIFVFHSDGIFIPDVTIPFQNTL